MMTDRQAQYAAWFGFGLCLGFIAGIVLSILV